MGLTLELVPSHPARAVGVSSEHLPFRDKNTEAQKRERDFRGSASCVRDKAELGFKLGPVWIPGHRGKGGVMGTGKWRQEGRSSEAKKERHWRELDTEKDINTHTWIDTENELGSHMSGLVGSGKGRH